MKRLMLSMLIPLSVLSLGCDRDDDDDASERAAEDERSEAGPGFGHSPIDKLCALVSCSDTQRTQLTKLIPPKAKRERPDQAKHSAADATLAAAFRSDSFSSEALAAYRSTVPDGGERRGPDAAMIVGVHDILTAPQRDTVADVLEAKGPGALLGHRGMGGKGHHKDKGHKDKQGKGEAGHGNGSHGERFAAELCEKIACNDGQAQAIATAITAGKGSHDRDADADAAFAEAFRADALAAGTVSGYLGRLEAAHHKDAAARDATIVKIHGLLDAEQRGVLADEIAEQGLRALMPERGHHGRGDRKHDEKAPARAPA
jgi:hypothetical protein